MLNGDPDTSDELAGNAEQAPDDVVVAWAHGTTVQSPTRVAVVGGNPPRDSMWAAAACVWEGGGWSRVVLSKRPEARQPANLARPGTCRAQVGPIRWPFSGLGLHPSTPGGPAQHGQNRSVRLWPVNLFLHINIEYRNLTLISHQTPAATFLALSALHVSTRSCAPASSSPPSRLHPPSCSPLRQQRGSRRPRQTAARQQPTGMCGKPGTGGRSGGAGGCGGRPGPAFPRPVRIEKGRRRRLRRAARGPSPLFRPCLIGAGPARNRPIGSGLGHWAPRWLARPGPGPLGHQGG